MHEFSTIDFKRQQRLGHHEVVFGGSKNGPHLLEIIKKQYAKNQCILVTRITKEQWPFVKDFAEKHQANIISSTADSKGFSIGHEPLDFSKVKLTLISAGTSDLFVQAESQLVLDYYKINYTTIADVGVAGIHRLLQEKHLATLHNSQIILAYAGMDAALFSVLGGLCSAPIIGVPTSVGYGATFDGLSALLAMMSSCAPGISVVNIDNGFGAAMCALRLLQNFCSNTEHQNEN